MGTKQSFDPLRMRLAGAHSIAASAGTGKTYTITTLYLRYLLETECRVEDILVTTFTEAATAELKERLRSRVREALDLVQSAETILEGQEQVTKRRADQTVFHLLRDAGAWETERRPEIQDRLQNALLNFDHAPVFTIHGFCHRVLQELVFETSSRFDIELVTSQDTLVEDATADFAAQLWTADDSAVADWVTLDETLWSQMRSVAALALENPDFPIRPDHSEWESLLQSTLLVQFNAQVQTLADDWRRHRAEVTQLLISARQNDWLNRNTHGREGQLEQSIDFVDRLIVQASPDVFTIGKDGRPEAVQRRLTQSELKRATKRDHKANEPCHHVFQQLDKLVEQAVQIYQHRTKIITCLLSHLAYTTRDQAVHRKQQRGIMSFSDLLNQVDRALQASQGPRLLKRLRDRYRVAMVDEFQDTDPVQYRIFRRVFQVPHDAADASFRSFIMIGDPKQSIYRFRGADIHSYLQATDETPTQHRHTLDTNWRSDKPLVDAVQAVFASRENPFLYTSIPLPDVEAHHERRFSQRASLEICLVPRHPGADKNKAPGRDPALRHVVHRVAAEIVAQQNGRQTLSNADGRTRPLVPGDIAVLCRTGKQLRMLQAELAERNVPAVLQTDESVFDTAEAEATMHVLRALIQPGNLMVQFNALASPLFGQNADQLESLRHDEQRLSQWSERFFEWHHLCGARGFIVAWRRLLDQMDVVTRLTGRITGERQVTNYLHLGELLHGQAVAMHAGPDQLLRWLEGCIADPRLRSDDETQLRLETDAAAVQLCTIHRSKGLEYPVVYYPTLWHTYGGADAAWVIARLNDDGRPLDVPEIDVGSDRLEARLQQDREETQAEDRRLLYVALTRARHQCRIFWTAVRDASDSALGQLMFGDLKGNESDKELDQRLRQWVESLAATGIEYRGLNTMATFVDPGRYHPPKLSTTVLDCRPVTRIELPRLVRTSFSALARHVDLADDLEIPDRDVASSDNADEAGDPTLDRQRVPLAEMPGGVNVGNLVHDVFEKVLRDGRRHGPDRLSAAELVQEHLQADLARYNLDPTWIEPLAVELTKCLTGCIAQVDPAFCMFDLPLEDAACELHFLLPVADHDRQMDARSLGSAFDQATDDLIRSYAARVGRVPPSRLRGFLEGYIDLVFQHQGRWFLLDYKTNQLGPLATDYGPSRLEETMFRHDYLLQYHLYAVALDRFLSQRVGGYRYERDFGGVIYLFVRGFDAGRSASQGVYFHRPQPTVIRAIASVLDGEDFL